jgi:hypothetical protein
MTLTKIDGYEVMYSVNQFPPQVWLKSGEAFTGQLIFQPDGSALPSDTQDGTQANLYYHLQDLQNVLDLLRNEKSMYLLASPPRWLRPSAKSSCARPRRAAR